MVNSAARASLQARKRARRCDRKHAIAAKSHCQTLQKCSIHRHFCIVRKFWRQMLLPEIVVAPISMRRVLSTLPSPPRGGGYTQN
jgi:hypothetical protein